MTYILGVSFDYHDSAAALISDDAIIAAAQEERFSRIKNDSRLPINAIKFCCEQAGIQIDEIDHIVYYENAILKLDRIVQFAKKSSDHINSSSFKKTINAWLRNVKYSPTDKLSDALGMPRKKIHHVEHHQSHAASAFYCSPFEEATVVTLDGVGEYETLTISYGTSEGLKKLGSASLPNSIGLFYSAVTAFLGFRVNEDEYKVMGMAGFGEPEYFSDFMSWFEIKENGSVLLKQEFFNFLRPADLPYTQKMIDLFGKPRAQESEFNPLGTNNRGPGTDRYYANIAASAQKCTEEIILQICGNAIRQTKCENLCMAGGVALNSLVNGRLKREITNKLYIQPAAGDAGSALGAALFFRHETLKKSKKTTLENPYLGKAYSSTEIVRALNDTFTKDFRHFDSTSELCSYVAGLLNEGNVVGWIQEGFEWGPRALGARSILASPLLPEMQDIVNRKIKFREPFRPFAPAVLPEFANEYFEMEPITSNVDPEYFMLAVHPVREEKRKLIPAVTHVDGTARIQLVNKQTNPIFYQLIKTFGVLTGTPILVNTSFNLRGEPIVASPGDAIKTFEWSGMDYLVLGQYVIQKEI
ncbi:MAG: carbamoyltransferase C-terminal domain-containing protein [Burkholderiales bacterium]|nr:carbamoyltransferase C-terminal domain-containing protein [Burkholderiales bacterium]